MDSLIGPYKIVILGEGRVGKTSLLRQYVRGTFDDREASTLSASYLEKRVPVRGKQMQLALWDTAGQERFHALAPIYYRDADGALLVYDVTDVESFRRVSHWVEELQTMGTKCAVAIVGNKIDLRAQAKVSVADAEAYARSISARHSLASAKLGQGVQDVFTRLAEDVLDIRGTSGRQAGNTREAGGPARQSARQGLQVVDDSFSASTPGRPQTRRKGQCCAGGRSR